MLGKFGEFLNKDVGALVKDAGKVLNSDVGTLAKGAGRVLNADLGELMRSTPQVATTAEAEANTAKQADAPQTKPIPTTPAAAPVPAKIAEKFDPDATPQIRKPPADAALGDAPFDPDATLQIKKPPAMAAESTPVANAAEVPRLTDELVQRHKRSMPAGTGLIQLLPYSVGEFERPHATPSGELTSDPVTAIYRVSGETVAVKLMQCWDADEAIERLNDIKSQSGENVRVANDGSWVLGQTAQGIVFAWNRDAYSFSVTSPKGIGTVARFLAAFPY